MTHQHRDGLGAVEQLLDAGEVHEALSTLHGLGRALDDADLPELARVTGRAAGAAGWDDLAEAAAALAAAPDDPRAGYDFGYAALEHGAGRLAVPALVMAERRTDGQRQVLTELVAAYESEYRHRDAVAALTRRQDALHDWPERYLLTYNALMDGDLTTAEHVFTRLSEPADERWAPARDRAARILERAAATRPAAPLDATDLRGWHFVLTGSLLGTLSPYGFAEAMRGRYAYFQDTYGQVLAGLRRLRVILEAAAVRPTAVAALPDRSSTVLGRAAAGYLGLPVVPLGGGRRPDTLVVAYDLGEAVTDEDLDAAVRLRAPGSVLYEHAGCWTQPPGVAADVTTLLYQYNTAPWEERTLITADGPQQEPADERPAERIAADILAAEPEPGPEGGVFDAADGDGSASAPDDSDAALAAFTAAVAPAWRTGTRRHGIDSPGPVRSAQFG